MKWFFVIGALILTVTANVACGGPEPTPSEEEIRRIVQSEVAKLELPEGGQGEAGPQGERGEQGLQGERGEEGAQGDRGQSGPPGEAGPQGDRGQSGPSGEAGGQGERGEQGPQGAAGGQGERGEPERVTGRPGERIDWSPCDYPPLGVAFDCGYLEVPADYRDPEAGSINIALLAHRATSPDQRIGYLLVNPGGPGGSGLDLVLGAPPPASGFTEEILERFDIVGFDPRGVGLADKIVEVFDLFGVAPGVVGGGSGPEFACGGPGEQLALMAGIDEYVDTPEEIAIGEAAANLCIESMGPAGGLLDSEYVARDMDEIRKALGAEKISYYGGSYGSTLGVWYATLFPDSVRAMVVDGAANPIQKASTQEERIAEQLWQVRAIASNLEKALAACDDPTCPIYNDGDPVEYYKKAAAKLDLVNAAMDNDPLAGYYGVAASLYNEMTWPVLWQGLFELNENDDPFLLAALASALFLGREPGEANFTEHVNCLDAWVLRPDHDRATQLDDFKAYQAAVEEMFPLLALIEDTYHNACPFYDQFTPDPLEGPLDGAGVPILVIGNRADPATPFTESEELVAETLSNGYLLETAHFKHVVYPGNQCVNGHVHRTLIDREYPDERRVVCEREDPSVNP